MDWRQGAFLQSFFLRARRSEPATGLILLEPAREQLSATLEYRIGGSGQVSIDALEKDAKVFTLT